MDHGLNDNDYDDDDEIFSKKVFEMNYWSKFNHNHDLFSIQQQQS